jgi:hypothetical protein
VLCCNTEISLLIRLPNFLFHVGFLCYGTFADNAKVFANDRLLIFCIMFPYHGAIAGTVNIFDLDIISIFYAFVRNPLVRTAAGSCEVPTLVKVAAFYLSY